MTLCYVGYMTDFFKAKDDLNSFLRELRKAYKGVEYLWVLEPKESGSWHVHMLTKEKEITAEKLQELWTHDCVDVQDVFNVKGIAYYLSPSYRKDVEAGKKKSNFEVVCVVVLSNDKKQVNPIQE